MAFCFSDGLTPSAYPTHLGARPGSPTIQLVTATGEAREGGVRTVENLRGPAGRLEALLNPGRLEKTALVSVLLCHPHPLFGGTLHNKVVYHAMKTFTDLGLPVRRFNFRGAGRSEGEHDHGKGEQDDVRAGIDWLAAEYRLPVVAAGFSFGAHMALRAGCDDARVRGLVSLGTPVEVTDGEFSRRYGYEFLAGCEKPKLFLSGGADPFGPLNRVESALEAASEPKRLVWVLGADHFFTGRLPEMQALLRGWLEGQILPEETD